MSELIDNLIATVLAHGHEVWKSGPATAEAIRKIEEAIGVKLPPSYASFLLAHGAISIYDTTVSGVIHGDDISIKSGTVLADTEALRSEGDLPAGFLVVGPHEDGAYCLDLNRRQSNGECPVVNYERGSVQHGEPVAGTFEEWLVEFCLKTWIEEDV